MKFAHKLTYHLLNIFSKWLQKKSFSSRIRFSRRMGYFVYYFLPIRKKLAALNIKKAFPERNKSFYKKIYKEYQDYFHKDLLNLNSKEALDYLNKRGLNNSTIKEFKLGFIPWKNDFYKSNPSKI